MKSGPEDPYCDQEYDEFVCCDPEGHEGDHHAAVGNKSPGVYEHVVCRWTQQGVEVAP